jgi:hypothetical protein
LLVADNGVRRNNESAESVRRHAIAAPFVGQAERRLRPGARGWRRQNAAHEVDEARANDVALERVEESQRVEACTAILFGFWAARSLP